MRTPATRAAAAGRRPRPGVDAVACAPTSSPTSWRTARASSLAWAIWLSGSAADRRVVGRGRRAARLAGRRPGARSTTVVCSRSSSSLCLLIANIRAGALFVATLVRPIEVLRRRRPAVVGSIAQAGPRPPRPASRPRPPQRPRPGGGPRPGRRAAEVALVVPDRAARRARSRPNRPPAAGSDGGRPRPVPPPPAQVGATIGILERLLIVVFVVIGAEAAVGFVVAAKTIARFRLLDDRDFAEYYLLGTLGSVSVAIFTGLLAKAALGI